MNIQKYTRILTAIAMVFAAVLLLLTTFPLNGGRQLEVYTTGDVTNPQNPSISSDTQSSASASQQGDQNKVADTTTVYWTPNGKVYHTNIQCLKNSATVYKGTVREAALSGKPSLCSRCAKNK